MSDKDEGLARLRDLVNQLAEGKAPGFVVLVDRPGDHDNLYTFGIELNDAMRLTSSAMGLFLQMAQDASAQIPEGTTIH